jgi:methylase of polypeptide subunit release factors
MGCVSTSERLPEAETARTAPLREALRAADFTADGLLELLGASAYAALARSETVPALRATRGGSPLETLVRLFLLQQSVPRERAAEALPLEAALQDGWLTPADGESVRATVDVRPYSGPAGEDWWIVADLGRAVGGAGGAGASEAGPSTSGSSKSMVLGIGGASTTLAGLTVRTPVGRALDLGTGCGVQALHAAQHASRVTATDLNPRALDVARLTLALSGASGVELRQGSLFEPVADEEPYDLIVSNPPFVISPGARLTYRDGGMAGDDLCRTLVQNAGERLAPGGYCQLLANWEHSDGEDWRERLRSWVPRGCDAWIVQREVQDVTQYAELWLRDAGDHRAGADTYAERYGAWLDEFESRGTTAVGFGWITLRRRGGEQPGEEPGIVVEEWPHPVEQPLGDEVAAHFARQDFLRTTDDAALLACRFELAEGVVQEQVGAPGAEDPEHVVLRQQRGMRRATKVDTVGAGFAGVCDGTLPAGRILDAIAQLLGEDPVALRDRTPSAIRLLVEQGFLLPAEGGGEDRPEDRQEN